jgi:hypothetical protein
MSGWGNGNERGGSPPLLRFVGFRSPLVEAARIRGSLLRATIGRRNSRVKHRSPGLQGEASGCRQSAMKVPAQKRFSRNAVNNSLATLTKASFRVLAIHCGTQIPGLD